MVFLISVNPETFFGSPWKIIEERHKIFSVLFQDTFSPTRKVFFKPEDVETLGITDPSEFT